MGGGESDQKKTGMSAAATTPATRGRCQAFVSASCVLTGAG